jgi:hypothetical protein
VAQVRLHHHAFPAPPLHWPYIAPPHHASPPSPASGHAPWASTRRHPPRATPACLLLWPRHPPSLGPPTPPPRPCRHPPTQGRLAPLLGRGLCLTHLLTRHPPTPAQTHWPAGSLPCYLPTNHIYRPITYQLTTCTATDIQFAMGTSARFSLRNLRKFHPLAYTLGVHCERVPFYEGWDFRRGVGFGGRYGSVSKTKCPRRSKISSTNIRKMLEESSKISR